MMIDAKKLSSAIRAKKKAMMSAEPQLVDTDAIVDIDPNEHFFMEKHAQIENALGSEDPIDARNTAMDESEHDAMTMGETTEEMGRMKRMKRLSMMIDGWDL